MQSVAFEGVVQYRKHEFSPPNALQLASQTRQDAPSWLILPGSTGASSQLYLVMRNVLHEKYREENTKGIQMPADTNSVKNNISVHHLSSFMENGSSNEPLFYILNSKHATTKIEI